MATYRHGQRDGLFDGVTTFNQSTNPKGGVNVPAGATSQYVEVGRSADNACVYISASAACSFVVQVAHAGSQNADGTFPDEDQQTYVWHDLYYLGTVGTGNSTLVRIDIPTGGGAIASQIPDWESGWMRLRRSDAGAAVTVTAGWELQSD